MTSRPGNHVLVLFLLILGCVFWGCRPDDRNASMGFAGGGIPLSPEAVTSFYLERVFKDYSVPEPRIYTERVWHTAEGDYRIECLDLQKELPGGQLAPVDPEELARYRRLLTQGLGYFAVNERGFEIRDAEAFLNNYNYTVLNDRLEYLDRLATLARITSHYQDRPNYTVWFDRDTGLVLKYVEDTLSVDPLYEMEVTHLELEPDFTGVQFYNRSFHIEHTPMGPSQIGQLGFEAYVPAYVPNGFLPGVPEKVVVEGLTRLRISYTDGIQEIVLSELSYADLMEKAGLSPGTGGVPGTTPGPLVWVTLGSESEAGLHAAHFTLGGTRIVVRSILNEMETASLLESLVPLY